MNKAICIFSILIFFTKNNYSSNHTYKPKSVLYFTENKGQFADQFFNPRPDVLFGGNDGQLSFFIKNNGISYQLNRIDKVKESEDKRTKEKFKEVEMQTFYHIDIKWLNCNMNVSVTSDVVALGYTNYYLEQCPNGALNVKSYSDVNLKNIYNNIDLHYYENNGHLKHDFIVAPHADYKQIQLEISGAEIFLQKDGSLLLKTPLGNIEEQAPKVYQNGILLKSKYVINKNCVSFEVENYDPNFTLLIDPVTRIWGTYYGGTGDEIGFSCATDAADDAYLVGYSNSNVGTLIATTGAHQTTFTGGNWDAFLVKFDGNGIRQWGTYYGGSGNDIGYSCSADVNGNLIVAGYSASTSSIVIASPGAYQTLNAGGSYDAFLVKFNSSGVRQWGTYLGSTGTDYGYSCSTDGLGNIFLAGSTNSTNGIVSGSAHQNTFGGGSEDGFCAKFNTSGTLLWSSYYGGTGTDKVNSCCSDAVGNIFIAGRTDQNSATIISSASAHQTLYGGGFEDAFLVKFDGSGVRQWATLYGGNYVDYGNYCATDNFGNVYLTGYAESTNGTSIASAGSHQSISGGSPDAFLAKFSSAGTRLWGTYYGGTLDDHARSCSVDGFGNVYMSGLTISSNGISLNGIQNSYGGGFSNCDAFLVKFNDTGVRQWATYYGGTGNDAGYVCVPNSTGGIYMAGYTGTSGGTIIATPGSHQAVYNGIAGMNEAYLVKFACEPLGVSIAAHNAICEKTSFSFSTSVTSSLSINFIWNGPNGFLSSLLNPSIVNTSTLNSGTYTLHLADGFGCSEIATTSITINSLPTISVSSSSTLICVGQSAIISSSGATTYSWNSGGTTNSISVSPQTTTVYTVTDTDSNGCINTATLIQSVNECTHIKSFANNLNDGVKIYPNPNNGNFTLEVSGFANISLVNSLGQVVYKNSLGQGSHGIAIENNTPGIYLVNILINNSMHSVRIVIQ
ncbi:DUF7948 domain-containing protein [Aurantibacillus circumpalustris]|uniref:DUF7948 domain-containing protein n=1 Tax=Aurantibacillus circumpalustris TaxID=3036359 RepID=UPI00295B4EB9|nr:SBBP repeat-containing protein [Aurantibacillus circumpalustris]